MRLFNSLLKMLRSDDVVEDEVEAPAEVPADTTLVVMEDFVELDAVISTPALPEQVAALAESANDELFEDDFESLMDHLGAEHVSAEESELAIRDATIEELNRNLQRLRPLGDQLAETEKERLRLMGLVNELQADHDAEIKGWESDVAKLNEKLMRRESAIERERERTERWRKKYEERKAVAGERWYELVDARKESKRLAKELEAARGTIEELTKLARSASTASSATNMTWLLDPNPDPSQDGVVREDSVPRVEG